VGPQNDPHEKEEYSSQTEIDKNAGTGNQFGLIVVHDELKNMFRDS
jgi:hypothetical protein